MLTVIGAIGRNKTYRDQVHTDSKRKFRMSLQHWLYDRVGEYEVTRIGDERHVANIERLSSTMSKNHGDILLGGTLRIGTAQKALNLYLKYCWARGKVREPPHCPIDSIVLADIAKCAKEERCRICADVTWTKIRSTHEYMHFVEKARVRAREAGKSLAQWELWLHLEREAAWQSAP